MDIIVVWFNPNKNEYYYKIVKGYYRKYNINDKNRYGHVIILTIPLYKLFYKVPIRRKVITKVISFLQYIEKRI